MTTTAPARSHHLTGRVWAVLAVVYVVWGSIYLGIKVTIQELPALGSMAVRFIIAGLLMLSWVVVRKGWRAAALDRRVLTNVVVLGVLLLGFGNGGNAIGQLLGVPSGTTALLIATVPMFVMMLEFFGGERPTAFSLTAIAFGLAGMAVLVAGRDGGAALPLLGVCAIVLGAFTWALGSWVQPKLTVPRNLTTSSGYQMLTAGVFLLFTAVVRGEEMPAQVGTSSLLGLVYLIVVGSIIGFSAYSWLLGRAPLNLIATHTFVNPVVAVALGVMFAGEAITSQVLIGGGLIVVSVALSIVGHVWRRPAPTQI